MCVWPGWSGVCARGSYFKPGFWCFSVRTELCLALGYLSSHVSMCLLHVMTVVTFVDRLGHTWPSSKFKLQQGCPQLGQAGFTDKGILQDAVWVQQQRKACVCQNTAADEVHVVSVDLVAGPELPNRCCACVMCFAAAVVLVPCVLRRLGIQGKGCPVSGFRCVARHLSKQETGWPCLWCFSGVCRSCVQVDEVPCMACGCGADQHLQVVL